MDKKIDEMKTTKRWLAELNQNRQASISLREMLEHIDGLEGIRYNGMPSSGKIGDPTLQLVMKKTELKLRLKNTQHLVSLIEKALSNLTDIERLIVERRYVNGMAWKTIARDCYYTRQTAYKIGKRGLEKVSSILFGKRFYI